MKKKVAIKNNVVIGKAGGPQDPIILRLMESIRKGNKYEGKIVNVKVGASLNGKA